MTRKSKTRKPGDIDEMGRLVEEFEAEEEKSTQLVARGKWAEEADMAPRFDVELMNEIIQCLSEREAKLAAACAAGFPTDRVLGRVRDLLGRLRPVGRLRPEHAGKSLH